MVDQDKPFKAIEVIDSGTLQLCKVACMSCIRGHRTTSCGIAVCRSKVFWTVKRPGRPANSCTCRYGATGRCKCVVARAACPHKAKKGGKRTGECRCDELGRFCCLIEPEHWTLILSLQKPTVDFFPTRESLEARLRTSVIAPPISYSIVSPQSFIDPTAPTPLAGPASQRGSRTIPLAPRYPSLLPSPQSTALTPRFGLMGVGGPQGDVEPTHDPLAWQGDALPSTPVVYSASYQTPVEESSCCQPARPVSQEVAVPPYMTSTFDQGSTQSRPFPSYTQNGPDLSFSSQSPPVQAGFSPSKIYIDYFNYQFPNAICQNCGLNGCTCKNCPPVMQNFSNGSWAQCCGRKHAQAVVPDVVPATVAPPSAAQSHEMTGGLMTNHFPGSVSPYGGGRELSDAPRSQAHGSDTNFDAFELSRDLHPNGTSNQMAMSDFLLSELDRPSTGCCGGDDT